MEASFIAGISDGVQVHQFFLLTAAMAMSGLKSLMAFIRGLKNLYRGAELDGAPFCVFVQFFGRWSVGAR